MKIKISLVGLLFILISCAPVKFRENQLYYFQEIKGNVSEIKTTKIYYDDKTGEIKSSYPYIFKYNSVNQPTQEIDGREPTGIANTFYHYNAKGQLKKVTGRSKTGLYIYCEYLYDEIGNVIECKVYDPPEKPVLTKFMKYDKYGNMIEEIIERYTPKYQIETSNYTIDYKKRTVTRQTFTNGSENNSTSVEYFDKRGNPIRMDKINSSNTLTAYKRFDKSGNAIEEIGWDGNPVTYIYQFDTVGNVVKQDAYYKGKLFYTNIFEITYRK